MSEFISKPCIIKLAKDTGIKSISEDSIPVIRSIMDSTLDDVIKTSICIMDEKNTKTLMPDDVYKALRFLGFNIVKF